MGSTAAALPKKLTLEEWAALDEDEPGELVDGWLTEEEVPDLTHESVVAWLVGVLRGWLIARGGFVFGSEAKVAVKPSRGRKPDVTAYFPGRTGLKRRGIVRVPPDIAVEVVSETPRDVRRDRIEKSNEYATFGVRWYWLIDPVKRTLEVLELGADGRYVHALGAAEGQVAPPGCDGLVLDLDDLWRELERLEDDANPEV
jgi:Uma2 family endonuclease